MLFYFLKNVLIKFKSQRKTNDGKIKKKEIDCLRKREKEMRKSYCFLGGKKITL